MSDQIALAPDAPKLEAADIEQAMVALASIPGMAPDKMQLLLAQLGMDKESLKAEVAQEIRQEIIEDLEPEADGGHPINFDGLESERSVTLGVGAFEIDTQIRWAVSLDGERIAQVVPDLIRYVYKAGPKALVGLPPIKLLTDILHLFSKPKAREDFKQAIYKELAMWFMITDPQIKTIRKAGYSLTDSVKALHGKKTVQDALQYLIDEGIDQIKHEEDINLCTAEFLREKCQPGQIVRAAMATYEVNHLFFQDAWAVLPGQLTGPLSMIAGQIMNSTKNLGRLNWDLQALLDGIGTMPTGGVPNGLIPSLQSMAGLPQLLGNLHSLNSGDIKTLSTDATTALDTSAGLTARTRSRGKKATKASPTATDPPASVKKNGTPSSPKRTKTAQNGKNSSWNTPDTSPSGNESKESESNG